MLEKTRVMTSICFTFGPVFVPEVNKYFPHILKLFQCFLGVSQQTAAEQSPAGQKILQLQPAGPYAAV